VATLDMTAATKGHRNGGPDRERKLFEQYSQMVGRQSISEVFFIPEDHLMHDFSHVPALPSLSFDIGHPR